MKFVFQSKFGNGEGNCFAACIASLLEIDLDSVPDFYLLFQANWFDKFNEWLHPLGFSAIIISHHAIHQEVGLPSDCYYLMGGMSPRGIMHSVIGLDGKMVHDPHPSGEGLVNVDDYTFFVRTFR